MKFMVVVIDEKTGRFKPVSEPSTREQAQTALKQHRRAWIARVTVH